MILYLSIKNIFLKFRVKVEIYKNVKSLIKALTFLYEFALWNADCVISQPSKYTFGYVRIQNLYIISADYNMYNIALI